MNFTVFYDYGSLCGKIAGDILSLLKGTPTAHICIAAGHSSIGIFEELIKLYQKGELDFSSARFTAMDEWLGMNENTKGSCGDFLVEHFLSKLNFIPENICLVNGKAPDLNEECRRIEHTIYDNGGLDYILLGVGMNGHLALNEPGTPEDAGVHLSQLDSVTKNVGKKYFDTAPELEGGITIGIGDIKKAKKVVLAVNGEKKAEIVKKIYQQAVSPQIPASFLKNWDNAEILCDKAAAALINEK